MVCMPTLSICFGRWAIYLPCSLLANHSVSTCEILYCPSDCLSYIIFTSNLWTCAIAIASQAICCRAMKWGQTSPLPYWLAVRTLFLCDGSLPVYLSVCVPVRLSAAWLPAASAWAVPVPPVRPWAPRPGHGRIRTAVGQCPWRSSGQVKILLNIIFCSLL